MKWTEIHSGYLTAANAARVWLLVQDPVLLFIRVSTDSLVRNMKLCSEMLLEVTVYCGKVRDQRGCLTATEHSL